MQVPVSGHRRPLSTHENARCRRHLADQQGAHDESGEEPSHPHSLVECGRVRYQRSVGTQLRGDKLLPPGTYKKREVLETEVISAMPHRHITSISNISLSMSGSASSMLQAKGYSLVASPTAS
jgi:hypothetical protein